MGRASNPTTGSGLLSYITPRTATLAIAILGIVIHLNTYSWLGALTSSLPAVPERGIAVTRPAASAAFVAPAGNFANSAAKPDQLIDLDILAQAAASSQQTKDSKAAYLPEWVAEAKAYLKAQGLNSIPVYTTTHVSSGSATVPGANSIDASAGPAAAGLAYTTLDDGAEDLERMQWDALRLVINTLRWYILLSVLCCCAGVVGVLRSQLLLSRLFVIHSFLDFLLSTLSLLALAIVCTYPTVRAHLCDEFGSGEVRAWFSSPSGRSSQLRGASTRAQALINAAASTNDLTGLSSAGSTADMAEPSGWETLLDGVFASENCEESFRSTLVPLLMVFGLFFTAVRLQCFFLVQRFYTTLLRNKVHQYGYARVEALESGGTAAPMSQVSSDHGSRRWKESKLLD